ncbi:putative TPR_REGION domain-containing protein [Gammaproteobacteria bacterium]
MNAIRTVFSPASTEGQRFCPLSCAEGTLTVDMVSIGEVRSKTAISAVRVKGSLLLGMATAVALVALTGCNTLPVRPLSPVEDHSVKVPRQAAPPQQQAGASSSPATSNPESSATAQPAPLPSMLEETPVRAEPLPSPPIGMVAVPARSPTALAPTPFEGTSPRADLLPGSAANAVAAPLVVSPDRGARPAQRTTPLVPTPTVVAPTGVPATSTPPTTVQSEIQLPTTPRPATSSSNAGVVALLGKADDQAASGQVGLAAATLERALRIEPENGRLWHELAGIRLKQGQLDAAVSVAEKSNSLARNQRDLQARNWRLIGVARQQQGQTKAAAEAMLRARSLEGSP